MLYSDFSAWVHLGLASCGKKRKPGRCIMVQSVLSMLSLLFLIVLEILSKEFREGFRYPITLCLGGRHTGIVAGKYKEVVEKWHENEGCECWKDKGS